MKNRFLRIALVVLALAAQASAGFFVYETERALSSAQAAAAALAGDVRRAEAFVGELRSAQTGLVANGQDPAFWVSKVAGLAKDSSTAIEKIDRRSLAPDVAQDLSAAAAAIADFSRAFDRVRDLQATDQPLTASALVFGDAAQYLATASGALASAASSQAATADRAALPARQREGLALAGAALLTFVVLLLLLPRVSLDDQAGEPEAPATGLSLSLSRPTTTDLDRLGRSGFDLDIPRPAVPSTDPLPEPPRDSEESLVEGLKQETELRLNTEARVDLVAAAGLCSDLARVKDAAQLPALLGRAADLLDASGIVLWLAGRDGAPLRPAASYGYSDHTISRMKALSGRSDNAVSVAFRENRMEVVSGTKERNGAVVVPVVTVNGCAGAMAAEIRHGAEASPAVQAVATIIAAQLASLVPETR